MDPIVNLILLGLGAVAFALGSGAITMLFTRQARVDANVAKLREMLPEKYVAKEDYRQDLAEIKGDVKAIRSMIEEDRRDR